MNQHNNTQQYTMNTKKLSRLLIPLFFLSMQFWSAAEAQTSKYGSDGRHVAIPKGWTSKYGSDGRHVAIPPGGTSKYGSDGRYVAIPKGWTSKYGSDGRHVAIPPADSKNLAISFTMLFCLNPE